MRRLVDHAALRLVERSRTGHLVEARLPEEIRAERVSRHEGMARQAGPQGIAARPGQAGTNPANRLEERIFRGRSGCARALTLARLHRIDHLMPRAQSGRNSYRSLVSCCWNATPAKESAAPMISCARSTSTAMAYPDGRLIRARLGYLATPPTSSARVLHDVHATACEVLKGPIYR